MNEKNHSIIPIIVDIDLINPSELNINKSPNANNIILVIIDAL